MARPSPLMTRLVMSHYIQYLKMSGLPDTDPLIHFGATQPTSAPPPGYRWAQAWVPVRDEIRVYGIARSNDSPHPAGLLSKRPRTDLVDVSQRGYQD